MVVYTTQVIFVSIILRQIYLLRLSGFHNTNEVRGDHDLFELFELLIWFASGLHINHELEAVPSLKRKLSPFCILDYVAQWSKRSSKNGVHWKKCK